MWKALFVAALACGLPAVAHASDLPAFAQAPAAFPSASNIYVHIGPTGLIPDAGAKTKLAGVPAPGTNIRVPATVTAALEIGYHVSPNWAVSVSTGIPPRFDILGAGTIARLGKLGSSVAGPVAVTAHYHFLNWGAFQPYVGAGAGYLFVFGSRDGRLARYRLDEAFGAVGQIGADLMITDRFGIFVDLKRAYLRTTARGTLAGIPVRSEVRLDPTALSGGIVVRF